MKGYIPQETIEEIRDRIDLVELISSVVMMKKRGRNYVGLCPFHLEDTPSFTVSPDKQIFYCFGCQKGGNCIDFLMEYEHLTFPEAAEKLAARAGVPLPEKEMTPGEQKRQDERRRLFDVNEETARFFQEQLGKAQACRAYLQRRDLSDEVIDAFALGYAPEGWEELKLHLRKAGFEEEELLRAGVVTKGESGKVFDRFRKRLMFPIADPKGKIIAFGGRIIGEGEPKYLNSAETPLFNKSRNLYGLHLAGPHIRETGEAILMEGYIDVMSAHQFGLKNAVAPLGTAFTEDQAKLLKRYGQKVLLAFDGDGAGRKAALRSMEILAKQDFRIRVLPLPDGMDPDDFLRKKGIAAWESLRENAPNHIEYLMERAFAEHDAHRAEGKADIVKALLTPLLSVKDAVEKNEYIRMIAQRLEIAEELLMADIRRGAAEGKDAIGRDFSYQPQKTAQIDDGAARFLCHLAMEDKDFYDRVEAEIGWDFLQSSPLAKLMSLIREHYEEYSWQARDLAGLAEEEARKYLLSFLMEEVPEGDRAGALEDCLRKIKRDKLENELRALELSIKGAEGQENHMDFLRLLQEFDKKQQELRKI